MKAQNSWSLKEIDEALGCSKGTAFIAFMQIKDDLVEDQDYLYLSPAKNSDAIEHLRQDQRIYAGTVNAILLSDQTYSTIKHQVNDD